MQFTKFMNAIITNLSDSALTPDRHPRRLRRSCASRRARPPLRARKWRLQESRYQGDTNTRVNRNRRPWSFLSGAFFGDREEISGTRKVGRKPSTSGVSISVRAIASVASRPYEPATLQG